MVSAKRVGVIIEPLTTEVTLPMRLSMEKAVELAVVHESMAELPAMIEVGLAERVQAGADGGGSGGVTVTMVEQLELPLEFVTMPL